MNAIPDNAITTARCQRVSNGEDQATSKCNFQQLLNNLAFSIVWEIAGSMSTMIRRTWMRVFILKEISSE
jgi:hypothetical protein